MPLLPPLALAPAILGLVSAAIALAGLLLRRPRIVAAPASDLLILAAHPDDCVISAGECAVEAARRGGALTLAYLTCGAPSASDEKATLRRSEAVRAWSRLGVPEASIHFLGLPESLVQGAWTADAATEELVRSRIASLVRGLRPGTAVFLPAEGESHPDHRALRRLALQALESTGRRDVRVLETVSYNRHFSLYRLPARSLSYLRDSLPFLPGARAVRSGFFAGPRPAILGPDGERLALKCDLLREFASQNGELLVELFGHPDTFREVEQPYRIETESVPWFLRLGKQHFSPSHALLCAFYFGSLLVGACALGRVIVRQLGSLGAPAALALAAASVVLTKRPRAGTASRRLTLLSAGAGLIAGALTEN